MGSSGPARIVYLPERLEAPVSWSGLKHDRERLIYQEAFWHGVAFGMEQVKGGYHERQALVAAITEAVRAAGESI